MLNSRLVVGICDPPPVRTDLPFEVTVFAGIRSVPFPAVLIPVLWCATQKWNAEQTSVFRAALVESARNAPGSDLCIWVCRRLTSWVQADFNALPKTARAAAIACFYIQHLEQSKQC